MTHRGVDRTVEVEGLARVEGEGSLRIQVDDGVVTDVALSIFEPPRLFEALLVGRRHTEAPDITARICGICPVAYQMSACAAIESACGVDVPAEVSALRRLLYCGEWIQSHALHIHLLHAPDFLGLQDAVELAEREPAAVERGLEMKRTGNRLMETIGGRAIHPVNVSVGGFYRAPTTDEIQALRDPVRRAIDAAIATVDWVSGFDFPDVEGAYRYVSLVHPDHYPIDSGRVGSGDGLNTSAAGFLDAISEEHVARSTALHARMDGRSYLTGPLARFALNRARLTPLAREAADRAALGPVCSNPFRSIVVRSVELLLACEEALRLIDSYQPPAPPSVPVPPRAAVGCGATEAPRGLLVHRYQLDRQGIIQAATIVPPTSQNQLVIEEDLWRVAQANLSEDDTALAWRCEQAVRNHDPCISCAAHFLEVDVNRS